MRAVLAIDQGTTGSTCLVITEDGRICGRGYREITQYFPEPGWVEHDADEIWRAVLATLDDVVQRVGLDRIAAIGITNQRETVVVWDAVSGHAIHRAIVWQDRRTADLCTRLKADGLEPMITAKTGLIIDPYFSGTKLAWLLDNVPEARGRAERGELKFGTIDCYLLWRLTGGKVHATDATNAARTSLFDIARGVWDAELCDLFGVPMALLPDEDPRV